MVTLIVKPDRSKTVVKCVYKKNRWFKKPTFMNMYQGNLVIVQGMKGKKSKKAKENREIIQILNIKNLTTKKDLVVVDGQTQKVQRVQKVQRMK